MVVHVGGRGPGHAARTQGWVFPGAAIDMDFANNRYSGASFESLTVVRASTGYAYEPVTGTWEAFAANVIRRTSQGLVIEEARTNLFVSPGTPATQSITVVNGTVYTVSCQGTGSLTLSGAGTGTVSQGSPVTFTASTTSLTVTTAGLGGSFVNVNVEAGSWATSPMRASTRAADVIQPLTVGGLSSGASLYIQAIPQAPAAFATNQYFGALSASGASTNRVAFFRQASSGNIAWRSVAGGVAASPNDNVGLGTGVRHKLILATAVGASQSQQALNGNLGTPGSPAAFPTGLNQLTIGINEAATLQQLNGLVERVAVFTSRLANGQLQGLTG